MNDTNLPVTGICLVTKSQNVPTGYQCIRKAFDDQTRDADLMADSLLERKDRFVCITRVFPLGDNRMYVLEDIKLINERDSPPPEYVTLSHTTDTREKGTTKRTICVKMIQRQAGMKCICDIIFLCRSKRPPQSYTLIGDINGLQMCIKEGIVPPFRPAPAVPTTGSGLYPNPYDGGHQMPQASQFQQQQHNDHTTTGTLTRKGEEKEALDGIPFEINPKYLSMMRKNRNSYNDLLGLDSYRILSLREIEQQYRYDFILERSSLSY